MKPVLTKSSFVRRYQENEFGNRSPTWNTLAEFVGHWEHRLTTGVKVHLRNRVAGGETFYNLTPMQAFNRWMRMQHPEQFYCSAMSPHEHNLLQGEVWDGPGGLYLHGSYEIGVPMRDALKTLSFDAVGLRVNLRLRQVMNDLSWDWFQWLLEAYPDHVIEFSAFDCCWGTVPGHNVVIWEVRNY